MTPYATISAVAGRQLGLVTRAQLRRAGLSDDSTRRLVQSGRLVRVRRGVYLVWGASATWHASLLSAVLAVGPGAVVSHRSAAVLWGLVDLHDPGVDSCGRIEVTSDRFARLDGIVVHQHRIDRTERSVRHWVPATTVERTILDSAGAFDGDRLGKLVDEALRHQLTTVARLAATLERHATGGGRRTVRPLRAVLFDRGLGHDPGANDWEQRMDRLWDGMGLPPAERQYRLRLGGRAYILDRAILDARIAVEWNGFGTHGLRSGFDSDSDRRARLAAAGWCPLDFTSRSSLRLIGETILAVYHERMGRPRPA